jgi:hypothetical protein
MRIGLYGYGPSDSVQILRDGLLSEGVTTARSLISSGASRFRGRAEDIVINYGSSNVDNIRRVVHNGIVFNNAEAVGKASNKLVTFNALDEGTNIAQLESTSSLEIARHWVGQGSGVYARTALRGHSGEGIVYVSGFPPEDMGNVVYQDTLPTASLYTKAVTGDRSEYRVHVAFNETILIQQKRRRNGWRDNEDYSDIVRNHGNGWIYATSEVSLPEGTFDMCKEAVSTLGLDFGAVDIIVQNDRAILVEINTAPGLQGESSRDAYVQAFVRKIGPVPEPSIAAEAPTRLRTADSEPQIFNGTPEGGIPIEDRVQPANPTGWFTETPEELQPPTLDSLVALNADIARHQGMVQDIDNSGREEVPNVPQEITVDSVAARLDAIFGNTATDLTATRASMEDLATTGRTRSRFRTSDLPTPEPRPAEANNLGSPEAPAPMINAVPLDGPGHYIADISEGVRTVICVLNSGEIYSAEHDLYLQAADISVVSQISL